jgi:hypothetical protein
MGLHQDRDETADAPVVSVSLGDSARFRIGAASLQGKRGRGGSTRSLILTSGDVLMFGGVARLAYHGIDRILPGTSTLLPGGGRLNLTLRRVTLGAKKTPGQKWPGVNAPLRAWRPGGDTGDRRRPGSACERGAKPARPSIFILSLCVKDTLFNYFLSDGEL